MRLQGVHALVRSDFWELIEESSNPSRWWFCGTVSDSLFNGFYCSDHQFIFCDIVKIDKFFDILVKVIWGVCVSDIEKCKITQS